MRIHLVSLALASAIAIAGAQQPVFEVASLKVNTTAPPYRLRLMLQKSGRVTATNVDLRELIQSAYWTDDDRLIGGPDWIRSRTFDLEARAAAGTTAEQAMAMMRALLAERFKLAVHTETRQLPTYRLTRSKTGGFGPRLRPSGQACAPVSLPGGLPPPPPPPPGMDGVPLAVSRAPLKCLTLFGPGFMSARSVAIDALAAELARIVRRPVSNETGLSGDFDLDLTYTLGLDAQGPPFAVAACAPELFTALPEQLGLRLEPSRGPVDVLVVDRAEPPTEN